MKHIRRHLTTFAAGLLSLTLTLWPSSTFALRVESVKEKEAGLEELGDRLLAGSRMIPEFRPYTSLEEGPLPEEEDPFFSDNTIDSLDPTRDKVLKGELHGVLRGTLSMLWRLNANEDPGFFGKLADQLENGRTEEGLDDLPHLSDLPHVYDLLEFVQYYEKSEDGDGEIVVREREKREREAILGYIRSLRWRSRPGELTYLIRQPVAADFAQATSPHSIPVQAGDIFLVDFGEGDYYMVRYLGEGGRIQILDPESGRFVVKHADVGREGMPNQIEVREDAWEVPSREDPSLVIQHGSRSLTLRGNPEKGMLDLEWDSASPPRFFYRLGLADSFLVPSELEKAVKNFRVESTDGPPSQRVDFYLEGEGLIFAPILALLEAHLQSIPYGSFSGVVETGQDLTHLERVVKDAPSAGRLLVRRIVIVDRQEGQTRDERYEKAKQKAEGWLRAPRIEIIRTRQANLLEQLKDLLSTLRLQLSEGSATQEAALTLLKAA